MKNFEEILKEVKSIANNITKEDFERALKEYDKIYNEREYDLVLVSEDNKDYVLTNQYFSVDTLDVFTDNTYEKVG